MSTSHVATTASDSTGARETSITIGKLLEDAQVTTTDTGWSEEEKERMRQAGFDGVDMIRAWYS